MLFCQSIDLVITNDTFYWFLSKSPLSQSEALLDKSRSALLECAIHVFNKRFTMSPLFAVGGDIVKEIPNLFQTIKTFQRETIKVFEKVSKCRKKVSSGFVCYIKNFKNERALCNNLDAFSRRSFS